MKTRNKEIYGSHCLEKLKESTSIADVTGNKRFWKRVIPLFGNKIKGNPNIALVESNDLTGA